MCGKMSNFTYYELTGQSLNLRAIFRQRKSWS